MKKYYLFGYLYFTVLGFIHGQVQVANYDIVTTDCVNFEYIITPEPGYIVTTGPICINELITGVNKNTNVNSCSPYNSITSTVDVGPNGVCLNVPPYQAPRYETGGPMPGITNLDGTAGPIVSLEHKHLVDEAVVIKANQVFNIDGGCGDNIDFFVPQDLGCKNISSITTNRQSGDFFECGCHDIDGSINYADGTTYNFFFRVFVHGCSNSAACPESEILLTGTDSQGATITFLDHLQGNCDEYVFHTGYVNGDVAVGPEVTVECDMDTYFEIIFRDSAGGLLECDYNVTVECGSAGECNNTVMDFDGVDDNISLTGIGTQSDFTIGCWFKAGTDNGGAEDRFFGIGNNTRLEAGIDGNNLWRYDENAGNAVTYNNSNVRDGEWHHFAIVAQGTNRKIYLDFEIIDDYSSGSTSYGPNMRIGSWAPGPGNTMFSGQIDDFRGYDVAIDENNICGVFNKVPADINSNLRLYFDFEEGDGEGDNTSLSAALNRGDLIDGSLEGFKLDGTASNYVCSLYDLNECEQDDCNPDVTAPLCVFPGGSVQIASDGTAFLDAAFLGSNSSDNCSDLNYNVDPKELDCDQLGSNNVTLTITDEAGNSSQCNNTVILSDPSNFCFDPCDPDDVSPVINECFEVVVQIQQTTGQASISVDQTSYIGQDECGIVIEQIDPIFVDCNQVDSPVLYTLTVSDAAGNSATCQNFIQILDPFGVCEEDCCMEPMEFQNLIDSGFTITQEGCEVKFSKKDIDACTRVDVDYDTGETNHFIGQGTLTYNYEVDGEYDVCLTATRNDPTGTACNTGTYCTTICISCHGECENEELQYLPNSAMVQPYLGYRGSINRRTDVCLTSDNIRYSAATFNTAGNNDGELPHEIRIYREGVLCKTFTNEKYCQVSEIQEKNGFLYVTGSFVGGNFVVDNEYTLIGNTSENNLAQPHAFVIKMTPNFDVEWAFNFGGPWLHVVEDIDIGDNGDFVITGTTRHCVDFDPNPDVVVKPNDCPDIITGYVARYSDNGNGLPNTEWVELLYTSPEVRSSFVHGLGVTFDEAGDVYAVGDYKITNETQAPCIGLELTSYGNTGYDDCNGNNSLYTTPASYSALGYLIKYNGENGVPQWITQLDDNNTAEISRGVCPRDVEVLDNVVYSVGSNFIAKHDKITGSQLMHKYNRGMDLEEVTIHNNMLHLVGFRNSYYQPGISSDDNIPSGSMLLSVNDLNCNPIKWLAPGYTTKRNYGKSIAVNDSRISIAAEVTLSEDLAFQLQYPKVGPAINIPSEYSFLVSDYECICLGASNTSCCENLSANIQETNSGDYCCSISIDNEFGFDVPKVGVKLKSNDASFSLSEAAITDGYNIENFTPDYCLISHNSGSIPAGINNNLLEFCLNNPNASSSAAQTFEIQYFQGSGDKEYMSCSEEISADCDNSTINNCGDLSILSATCIDEGSNIYELSLRITNTGIFDNLADLALSGLPDGYLWSSCTSSSTGTIGQLVDLGNLASGQSTDVCVRVNTNESLDDNVTIPFNASFGSQQLESFCTGNDYEFNLEPCCASCDDFQIVLPEISSCCYNFGLDNVCSTETPNNIIVEGVNGKIVNVDYDEEYLALVGEGSTGKWYLWPLAGFSAERDLENIFDFCLDATGSESPSIKVTISYNVDPSTQKECIQTVQSSCSGNCVTLGFDDTSISLLGSDSESYALGCGSPPVPISCPDGKEIWVRGNFNCSMGCEASIELLLEFEDGTTSWMNNVESDGSWETLLNDYIDAPGEYRLRVRGNCDSWHTICYYSFIVPEDCYSCDCIDFEDDVALGFNNSQQGFCEIINTPYALNECDEVTWFVNNIEGGQTTGNEEFGFAIVSGTHEVCMSVVRTENDICQGTQCYTFVVDCDVIQPLVLDCGQTANTNGDFAIGDYMSLHESDIPIPGWKYNSGEAWFFENGGAYGDDSGYMHIAATKFEEASMEVLLNSSMYQASSSSNSINVFFDLKTYSSLDLGNFVLRLKDESLTQDVLVPFEGADDNVWRTVDINIPLPDNIQLDGNETIEFVQFMEDIFSNTSFSIDNVCVEVHTTTSAVEDEIEQSDITIYPNPSNGMLFVNSDRINLSGYKIFSTNGQLVKTVQASLAKEFAIDLSDVESGVYFIQMQDTNRRIHNNRFIKL